MLEEQGRHAHTQASKHTHILIDISCHLTNPPSLSDSSNCRKHLLLTTALQFLCFLNLIPFRTMPNTLPSKKKKKCHSAFFISHFPCVSVFFSDEPTRSCICVLWVFEWSEGQGHLLQCRSSDTEIRDGADRVLFIYLFSFKNERNQKRERVRN